MQILVLTSTFRRHNFVINTLVSSFDVVGVWQEAKSFKALRFADTADEETLITDHFTLRDAAEAKYFPGHSKPRLSRGAVHRRIPVAAINDSSEIARMEACKPDVVAVFGTGLLSRGIIERFGGRIINIHLGLSPYYRGAGTNFWPLVNREPEAVGATILYLDAGIDTGDIIGHVRPDVLPEDGPHDVGNKAITAAAQGLLLAVRAHVAGRVRAVPQTEGGRLYQRKDFSASAVQQLRDNFATGMISEYLDQKALRDARFALIALPVDS